MRSKKLRLLNGKVRVGLVGAAATTVPLPVIEIDELGPTEGGVPGAQATIVMKSVVGKIVVAIAGAAGDLSKTGGAAAAIAGLKKAGEAIKGHFDRKKEPKAP